MNMRVTCHSCPNGEHVLTADKLVVVYNMDQDLYYITYLCPKTRIRQSYDAPQVNDELVRSFSAAGSGFILTRNPEPSPRKGGAAIDNTDLREFCEFLANNNELAEFAEV